MVACALFAGLTSGGIGPVCAQTAAPAVEVAELNGVIDARFGVHPDMTRFVLEMTQPVSYRVTTESDPYRVVVDISDLSWPGGSGTGKGLVRSYRSTQTKPGVLRLDMETTGPVALRNVELIPARDGHQPRLVIDLRTVAAAEFAHAAIKGGARAAALDDTTAPPPSPPPSQQAGTLQPPPQTLQLPASATASLQASSAARLPTPPAAAKPAAKPASLPAPAAAPPPAAKPLVAIDPGHGGPDPGAISPSGVHEKDLTLATAREVRRQLEASGRYRVMLTRDRDEFIPLRDRVAKARDAGVDLFISLHADIIDNPSIGGLSIYTLSDKASDHEAETLAAKENRADAISGMNLSVENKEVASILISLAQRDTMNQSTRFAGLVLREVGRDIDLQRVKPHREAGFAVLTAPDVPSVLIEMGYLSNKRDHDHLTSASFRERFAKDMVRSLDDYFKWLVEVRKS